ncbi:DUF1353 domain-containing protein [Homoserinimonas sp. OAct 916]|uniref:DUF1353 domain-containing protein n=1 Tax=Homoserinimonas sp. OAct 916 TaxID=2211450 RepID=UPI000DBE729C|nr:DUF1353 domain-containing protein [Homoserinimonas sp. OAct 916]
MPFFDEHGQPLDRIYLLQRAPRHFQLLEPISFLEVGRPESERVQIPAHDPDRPAVGDNQTDLASVPTVLWGLIASYGRQTSAALLHDHLSDEARHGDPATRLGRRRGADHLFRIALIESSISATRSWIMWAAVAIQKFWEFRRWQAIVMTMHAIIGVLLLYAVVALAIGGGGSERGFPLWMLALLALPAATGLVWWRDAMAFLVVTYCGAFLAPFMVAGFLGQLVLLGLEAVGWLVTGTRTPPPKIGPTVMARRQP